MKYYTADWHLFHQNVIRYSNRPFGTVEEMNEALVSNTNNTVGPNDELYFLGDVGMGNIERIHEVLRRIVCKNLHLIEGNHDPSALSRLPIWKSVSQIKEVKDYVGGTKHPVVLCHYKMVEFNRSHYGALQLFGHAHGTEAGNQQQIDVGVDCWDYRPITLVEAKARMETLDPMPRGAHSIRE